MTVHMHNMDWSEYDQLVQALLAEIKGSGYEPDIVLGILRGGYHPAAYLANALRLPLSTVRILRNQSNDAFAPKSSPQIVSIRPNFASTMRGKKVLIVDDIATYGETLRCAVALVQGAGSTQIKTATLITHGPAVLTAITVDYSTIHCQPRNWFVFPWEHTEEYR